MDTRKKVLLVGAATLAVIGLVVAAGAAVQGMTGAPWKGWKHGGFGKANLTDSLGLPENATREQVSDAMWEKQLKDLGLTDQSTLAEYRQAIKAKMQSDQETRMQDLRTKLNLPANASNEDLQAAMGRWRTDNSEMLRLGMGKGGFGHGPRMGGRMGPGGCGKNPEPGG